MKMGVKVSVIRLDRPLWMSLMNLFINLVLVSAIVLAGSVSSLGILWAIGSGATIGVLIAMMIRKQWHYYPATSVILDESVDLAENEGYRVKVKLMKETDGRID